MNNPLAWATALGFLICMIWFMRLLSVVYQDGKLDQTAVRVMRKSSLLPLAIMVVLLPLAGFGLATSVQTIRFIPWAILLIAFVGSIWVVERGIREIRKYRAS